MVEWDAVMEPPLGGSLRVTAVCPMSVHSSRTNTHRYRKISEIDIDPREIAPQF